MVPPDSHRVSRAPWYSGTRPEPATFRLQDCHLLWCAVPGISARLLVCDSMWPSPTTPVRPKPVRFGLIRVRSPLLTESQLFSLPRGTEMVHFPRFASSTLCIHVVGLPHSDIPGSKRACRSPRLIAACCVLHRLSVPRHPPSTLSNLTIKCLDLMRSAVARSNKNVQCISLKLQPIFNCQRTCDREDQRCAQWRHCEQG
jgi:hypothetical protein